ncbi:MAG: chorismate-binding protein, partial [Bdellovibrionales bacterium]|nr:chorismate-binding protein [Bdellovibrionales bacterium]
GVYCCDFRSKNIQSFRYQNIKALTNEEYRTFLKKAWQLLGRAELVDFKPNWKPIDEIPFHESFDKIKQAIDSGWISKAVPIAYQKATMDQFSFIDLSKKISFLYKLTSAHSNLIPYGQWTSEQGFMGITPEVLFDLEGRVLSSMALAGTSTKTTEVESFLADPKERQEHQIVVNDIAEKLKEFGELHLGHTQVYELPFFNHLKTNVIVNLKEEVSFIKLLTQMHPTSALGIYPNNDYWNEFINLPNQKERKNFGAPWGFKLGSKSFFLVSIRRLEWDSHQVVIPAGCGVVAQSDFDKELAEVQRKINSVKKFFEEPSLLVSRSYKEYELNE